MRSVLSVLSVAALTGIGVRAEPIAAAAPAAEAPSPGVRDVDFRTVDRELQTRNAARLDNGGRIRLELLGESVFKDGRTFPPDVVDGDVHSRQVMTGVPYRFHMDLVDELPVEQIHLICSDYATEACPRELEVKLSDGTVYSKVLEKQPADRRSPKPRQTIDVGGRKARWVEVKVLSNHPGGLSGEGKPIAWGGLGEIEVITSADLSPYLELTEFNPDLPQDIRSAATRADYSHVSVALPEPTPLGERPGIYLSAEGWRALFQRMRESERGKETLSGIPQMADAYLEQPIEYPDPSVPAQLKDRNDAAARSHDALAKQAGVQAYAYRITGEEKYARRARDILVGYARLYPNDYEEHRGVNGSDTSKVMAQRLSEAMWVIPLIQAYDLASDAKCFSETDRRLVQEDLIRHALTFINGKTPADRAVAAKTAANPSWRTDPAPAQARKGALGNWTAFYNMAYLHGGCVLGDQDWIDLGADGLKYMLENGIGEDGMWGEGAIGYQQFARHAIVGGLEALACKGVDLWSYKTNVFKNLFDSEFAYAYPDGTSPGINDSGRAAVGSGWTAMAFDYAYLRYGDSNYCRTINEAPRQLHHSPACYFPTRIYETLPEVPVKGQQSIVFDKLGYAILRGRDGDGETFLLMDYGPHGGVHGHPDKLNLILFADGDELAGEPQSYRYEDPLHQNWTRPSIAHWTFSVDEHSQNPTTGRLLCFADAGDVKVMRAQAAGAFAGVALDRTVVQLPGYIVDIYRGWGPAEHTFDYPLSFPGKLHELDDVSIGDRKPMASVTPGYMHILAAGPRTVDGPWAGVWEREPSRPDAETANRVEASVLPGAKPTQVWVGTVPGERHHAVLRRVGQDVRFVCVVDPFRATSAVESATELEVDGTVPTAAVRVVRTDGGADLIVVRYDPMNSGQPADPTTLGDFSTQALVTVIRLNAAGDALSRLDIGEGNK